MRIRSSLLLLLLCMEVLLLRMQGLVWASSSLSRRVIPTAFLSPRHHCCRVPVAWFSDDQRRLVVNHPTKIKTFVASQPQQSKADNSTSREKPSTTRIQKKKTQQSNKKSKKKKKELFRAERVLANRSGKTRAECHKLLTRYAVSILEEDDNHDNSNEDSSFDPNQLRVISAREQIPMTARLFINQKFEVPSNPPLLMVYHKPKWVLSTMGSDAKERRNLQNLKFAGSKQMHPVGRLDYDTSGLLLFSSSGKLTQKLLHPKYEHPKEYVAVVTGTVVEEPLKQRLEEGIELADIQSRRTKTDNHNETFLTRAQLLQVHHWPSHKVAPFWKSIRTTLPPEYNVTDLNLRGYMDQLEATTELSDLRLVVHEGKHRMVRRMLASCGHPVVALKRERIGVIELGDLPEGQFRSLTEDETEWAQTVLDS